MSFILAAQTQLCAEDTFVYPSATIQFDMDDTQNRPPVITSIALDPNENRLAAVGDDHVVRIVDTASREVTNRLDRHTDWIRTAAFSPNGRLLATAGNDRSMMIWNTTTWTVEKSIFQRQAIQQIAFSCDGKHVATVGFDHYLRVYAVERGWTMREFRSTCPQLTTVTFSPKARWVFAAGRDGRIQCWDLETNELAWDTRITRRRIRSLDVSRDGTKIVVAGDDRNASIRRASDGVELISTPTKMGKTFIVLFCGENHLAAGGTTNDITVWNLKNATEKVCLRGHSGSISSAAFDRVNQRLYSASYDTTISIWNLTTLLRDQVALDIQN